MTCHEAGEIGRLAGVDDLRDLRAAVKRRFIEALRKDPLLRSLDPEQAWTAIERGLVLPQFKRPYRQLEISPSK
jgi:hypothetical protein